MFDDIGKKIKTLAWIIFIVGSIGSFILGIILIVSGAAVADSVPALLSETANAVRGIVAFIGVIIALGGTISAIVSALFIYGYGEIIMEAQKIRANTDILVSVNCNGIEKENM